MKKVQFDITGMTCSACSARVEKAVNKLDGTADVVVNLLTNRMQLSYDEDKTDVDGIIESVERAGYGASVRGDKESAGKRENSAGQSSRKNEIEAMRKRLVGSIAFLIPTMYIAMNHMLYAEFGIPVPDFVKGLFHGTENAVTYAFSQFLLILPILYLNKNYYIHGFRNLWQKSPNMDSLVALGSMASAVFGVFAIFRIGYGMGHGDLAVVDEYIGNLYFESAGTIVTLISVGKYLEAVSKGKTSIALEKLMNLAPKEARVIREGTESVIPVSDIVMGDIVVVRSGESFPVDGVVTEGETSVDESAITGESMPVYKVAGDSVTAATMNQQGFIKVRAERVGEDTTISQIIRLVDEASASKAPIARLADKISGIFVPVVICIALIAGGVWLALGATVEFSFSIAIAILVISCPCALGLATPVAIMVGTGKGAENGILIKSGEALEVAHGIDVVVVDKTGTLTEGRPFLTDFYLAEGISEPELFKIALGLENMSEHPLAKAVLEAGNKRNIEPYHIESFKSVTGRGVEGKLKDGARVLGGNAEFLKEEGVDISKAQEALGRYSDEGKTPLMFARNGEFIGMLLAEDLPKESSYNAVREFQKLGIEIVMLTGDNERVAKAVGKKLGVAKVIAGVMPKDKAEAIKNLQAGGKKVAMIGDGVNDAPALMQADLGIAIGAGTDVAIESAGAVLVRNDLMDAVSAIALSRAVIRNIKENLFWAFIYNVIGIPLAAGLLYPAFGVKLSPMFGAAAMSMSSVCVVLNALRLRNFKSGSARNDSAQNKTEFTDVESTVNNKIEEKKEGVNMEKVLNIEGMMCGHCQKHVHTALSKMDGVTDVEVNLEGKKATVKAGRDIAVEEFKAVIEEAGYELVG